MSPLGNVFGYCKNRRTSLLNYLANGIPQIDINPVKNATGPLAPGRKNNLFAEIHDTAKNIAMLYSFFGICKKL